MKGFILGALMMLVLSLGSWLAFGYHKGKLYTVFPVTTAADIRQCVMAHGRALMVADLDAEGILASGWVTGCIVEVK